MIRPGGLNPLAPVKSWILLLQRRLKFGVLFGPKLRPIGRGLQPLPVRYLAENIDQVVEKPPHWETMLEIATKLSQGTDFVRVDLYDLPDRVVFGELTNYPNTGDVTFDPPEYDDYFGSFWNYSRSYYQARPGSS